MKGTRDYDIIIIGGGHNGLVAGNYLAKKGYRIAVLEKRKVLGGLATADETNGESPATGILHDTSQIRQNVISELGLQKFGLRLTGRRPTYTLLGKENKAIVLDDDPVKAQKSIAQHSSSDAIAYIEYRAFVDKIAPLIRNLLNNPAPDILNFSPKNLLKLAGTGQKFRKMGKKTLLEFMKVVPMSVADFLNEKFETDFLKAGLAAPGLQGSFAGPRSAYTTFNLLVWESLATDQVLGGAGALIAALEAAAQSNGVDLCIETEVTSIMLDDAGAAGGVSLKDGTVLTCSKIISTLTPGSTFFDLIDPKYLDYRTEQGILHYRSRGTTAKLNITLSGKPSFHHDPSAGPGYYRTGNGLDDLEKAFDAVKYGDFSPEPVLDIHVPDSEGHHVLSVLAHYVPYELKGGWDQKRVRELEKVVMATLETYIGDLQTKVQSIQTFSPVDLEEEFGLTSGHIWHGEPALDQFFTRPLPHCAHHRTSIPGLYLGGSGSFPGGGITGAPGRLAAQRILSDQ